MDQKTTRPKPRSYTEDYKRQVVDLVVSSGRTSTAVAGEVGLHPTLLCRWVRQYSAGTAAAEALRPAAAPFLKPVPVPTADQAAEIAQLRRECDRLRMERDILKRMARPVCKRDLSWRCRSASTYPVSGANPGQDGYPRVSGPHKSLGAMHHI
jgi:transposase